MQRRRRFGIPLVCKYTNMTILEFTLLSRTGNQEGVHPYLGSYTLARQNQYTLAPRRLLALILRCVAML